MKLLTNQLKGKFSILAFALVAAACNYQQTEAEMTSLQVENDSLARAIEDRDSLMNEVMESFYQIEKDLSFIKEQRNIISVDSESPEIETSRKDRIVNDVKELAGLLEENKKDLAALHQRLKKSGLKVKNLEKRMLELSSSLEERNSELLALRSELEQKDYEVSILNEQIAGLETEKVKRDTTIAEQLAVINNLNKAWYTVGTKKELEELGVVKKVGGFLGIGSTRSISPDFKSDYFSEIDLRDTKEIKIQSEEAILISEHPSSSYEFVVEEDTVSYLAINNINEFYKFSKYVVLEVK